MAEVYAINEEDLDAFVRTAAEAPSVLPRAQSALEALQRLPDPLVGRPAAFQPRLDSVRRARYAAIGELVYGEMFRRQERSEAFNEGLERVRSDMMNSLAAARDRAESIVLAHRRRNAAAFKRFFGVDSVLNTVIAVWSLWLLVGTDGIKAIGSLALRWVRETAKSLYGMVSAFGPPLLDAALSALRRAWLLVRDKLEDPWMDFWTAMSGMDPKTTPRDQRNGLAGFAWFLVKETLYAFIVNIPLVAAALQAVLLAEVKKLIVDPLTLIAGALVPDFILDAFDTVEDAHRELRERWLAEHSTLVGRVVVLHDEDEETQAVKSLYNLRQEVLGRSMELSGDFNAVVTETGQHYVPSFSRRMKDAFTAGWHALKGSMSSFASPVGLAALPAAYAAAAEAFSGHAALARAKAAASSKAGVVLDGGAALAAALDAAAREAVAQGLPADASTPILEDMARRYGAQEALHRDRKGVEAMLAELVRAVRRVNRAEARRAYRDLLGDAAKSQAFLESRFRTLYDGTALLVDFMLGGNAAFESVEHTARAFTGSLDGDEPAPESIYRIPISFAAMAMDVIGSISERFDRAHVAIVPTGDISAGEEREVLEGVEGDEGDKGGAAPERNASRTRRSIDLDSVNVVDLRRPVAAVRDHRAALDNIYARREARAAAVKEGWRKRAELLKAVFLDGTLRPVRP